MFEGKSDKRYSPALDDREFPGLLCHRANTMETGSFHCSSTVAPIVLSAFDLRRLLRHSACQSVFELWQVFKRGEFDTNKNFILNQKD